MSEKRVCPYCGEIFDSAAAIEKLVEEGKALYYEGKYDDAVKTFRRALEIAPDFPAAVNAMRVCYEYGKGVAKDIKEAVRLYKLAAAQGDEDAKKALKRLGY